MSRAGHIAVVVAGLAVSVLIGLVRDIPASDLTQLVGIAFGTALAIWMVANLGLRFGRVATLRAQVVIAAMASVVATGVGTMAAARAMFVSAHDLTALLVVLAAAATIGLLCSLQLGARVGNASRVLSEMTRQIGDGTGSVSAVAANGTSSAVELDVLARELEAMSHRLAEAQQREQLLDRSRRELVAWVSHDLRTPLAGIRAMAEALQDGVADDEATINRYHAAIRSETERLTQLVDDLFELSRLQADAVDLRLEPGSLGDVVSDALASAQALAAAENVRLDGRLLNPPSVELATPELGRVLRNLLDNAIRHTPPGGTVTVEVGGSENHGYVTVHDECGGIPEGELDRVFELAYRGDSARTPDDRRGGLGLTIARGLVEAHRGDLVVHNDGDGCRFTVRLPRRQPHHAPQSRPDRTQASPRR